MDTAKRIHVLGLASFLWLSALSSAGFATTVTFEGLSSGTILTNQISDLSFTSTIVLTAGVSLNEFEFPPHSGSNVANDLTGPISITFATAQTNISGYFTYSRSLTLQAFNASDTLVDSIISSFSENFVSSGNSPNELLSLSGSGITKVVITGDPGGNSFTLDDLSFSGSVVPLPSTLPLFATGLGALGLLGWRRKRKQVAA